MHAQKGPDTPNTEVLSNAENITKKESEEKQFLSSTTQLVMDLKKLGSSEPITPENLADRCKQAMEVVETYINLSGEQKKQAVIQALKQVISEQTGDHDVIMTIVDLTIPVLIDTIVDVAKGKTNLRTKTVRCCFELCC